MSIALTGTPGVGKTSTAKVLEDKGYPVFYLNEWVKKGFFLEKDEERNSFVADIDGLKKEFKGKEGIFESHFSHLLETDKYIVLRCSPEELFKRGVNEENIEAECLDLILQEALEKGRDVSEIDTTNLTPKKTAEKVEEVMQGKNFSPGSVDWSNWIWKKYK